MASLNPQPPQLKGKDAINKIGGKIKKQVFRSKFKPIFLLIKYAININPEKAQIL